MVSSNHARVNGVVRILTDLQHLSMESALGPSDKPQACKAPEATAADPTLAVCDFCHCSVAANMDIQAVEKSEFYAFVEY